MLRKKLWIVILGLSFLMSGCAFHSTAKDWNGLMGVDGQPAYYEETSKVAFKFLIMIPFLGNVGIDGMMKSLTADIAAKKGNNVRIVQGSSENYWYGFPPVTWVITPVITTVAAEYTPDQEIYKADQKVIQTEMNNSSKYNPLNW